MRLPPSHTPHPPLSTSKLPYTNTITLAPSRRYNKVAVINTLE